MITKFVVSNVITDISTNNHVAADVTEIYQETALLRAVFIKSKYFVGKSIFLLKQTRKKHRADQPSLTN